MTSSGTPHPSTTHPSTTGIGAQPARAGIGLSTNETGLPSFGAGSPRVGAKKPIPPPPGRNGSRAPDAVQMSGTVSPRQSADHVGQVERPEPKRAPVFPEEVLRVTPLADPVLDRLGHDPLSTYVERFWLPIYGPSCLLLIRKLAAELAANADGFEMNTVRWAKELGVGMKGGRNGPLWRAVERGCRFGAMQRNGDLLAIRRRLPPLTARQVERLPPRLQASHDRWVETRLARPKRSTVTKWSDSRANHPLGDAA